MHARLQGTASPTTCTRGPFKYTAYACAPGKQALHSPRLPKHSSAMPPAWQGCGPVKVGPALGAGVLRGPQGISGVSTEFKIDE